MPGSSLNWTPLRCSACSVGQCGLSPRSTGTRTPYSTHRVKAYPLNSAVNDLGVLLSDRLTFAAHFGSLVKKMTGFLSYLARIRWFLTDNATNIFVQSLVLSRMNYSPAVWGALDKTLILKLQKTVTSALHIIFDVSNFKYDGVTQFLKKLDWLTIEKMPSVATACFTYKVANDIVPDTLARMFQSVYSSSGSHSTWKKVIDL